MASFPNDIHLTEEDCPSKSYFFPSCNDLSYGDRSDWSSTNYLPAYDNLLPTAPPYCEFDAMNKEDSLAQIQIPSAENYSYKQELTFCNNKGAANSTAVDFRQNLPIFSNLLQPDGNNSCTIALPDGHFYNEFQPHETWSSSDYRTNDLSMASTSFGFYSNKATIEKPFYPHVISPVEVIDLTQSPRIDEYSNENYASTDAECGASPNDGFNINMLPSDGASSTASSCDVTNIQDKPINSNVFHPPPDCWNESDDVRSVAVEQSLLDSQCNSHLELSTSSEVRLPKKDHSSQSSKVSVGLANRELWQKFFRIGTEMIITKAGRRMFPAIKLEVKGLKPLSYYVMAVDVIPIDNNRYRYVYHSSQWMAAGTTDAHPAPRFYVHPDSPCRGEIWMRQPITFDKLKLTNHEANKKGHIILNSMHKYQPRVHVIECHGNLPSNNLLQIVPKNKRVDDVIQQGITTVSFPECVFTTVTAYQNQQITKLKIDRNPFAKGFRETNKQWRPNASQESSSTTAVQTNLAGRTNSGYDVTGSLVPSNPMQYSTIRGDDKDNWNPAFGQSEYATSNYTEPVCDQCNPYPPSQSLFLDWNSHAGHEEEVLGGESETGRASDLNRDSANLRTIYDFLSEPNCDAALTLERDANSESTKAFNSEERILT